MTSALYAAQGLPWTRARRRRATTGIPPESEKHWQGFVVKLAQLYGWEVQFWFDSRHSPAGWPDLFATKMGSDGTAECFAAELKRENGVVAPAQEHRLRVLAACGIPVYVWRPSQRAEVIAVLSRKAVLR